ncbi:MAG: hypothetical protein K0U47_09540 [Epsilonproteobacteria bacterium]|nr:hypothetical protein [Campylobacterota bacterium]
MKILFFSVAKHQYRYYTKLCNNLPFTSKHLFFPSIDFSYEGFKLSKEIDVKSVHTTKLKELDAKYKYKFTKTLYKWWLKIQIPLVVSTVYKNIKKFDPDFIVLWNGKKFHQAIALQVAKKLNKKTVFFENGVLPNTTTMDFQGVNASNSLSRDLSAYQNLIFDANKHLPKELIARDSKHKKPKYTHSVLPKKYIFIPFQVSYDTQVIQHSPWIKDMRVLFEIITRLATKHNLHFVIKEHPSDRVSNYSDLYQKCPSNVTFSQECTQVLIEHAQAVMTINSTVAIEALLFDKRVIVLGEAFFAIDGIVKKAENFTTLTEIIAQLEDWEVDTETITKFLKHLQFEYLIPATWKAPNQQHYDQIAQKFKVAHHVA